ncbi:MAG: hypothetical protein ACUVX9_19075, partial [Anaerolineae bacterium]
NRAGHLRLTTVTRTTQHIGNRVSPRLWEQMPKSLRSAAPAAPSTRRRRGLAARILRSGLARRATLSLYRRLFDWLTIQ